MFYAYLIYSNRIFLLQESFLRLLSDAAVVYNSVMVQLTTLNLNTKISRYVVEFCIFIILEATIILEKILHGLYGNFEKITGNSNYPIMIMGMVILR